MSYFVDIEHKGLGKFKRISGRDEYVVQRRAAMQLQDWEDAWQKKVEKENQRGMYLGKGNSAVAQTKEAVEALDAIANTLKHTLSINDAVTWERLKIPLKYKEPQPIMGEAPVCPSLDDQKYQAVGLWERVSHFTKKHSTKKELQEEYHKDLAKWGEEISSIRERYEREMAVWRDAERKFLAKAAEDNKAVDRLREKYLNREMDSVVDYCDIVLSNSEYPDLFPQEFELDFNVDTRILIVDYRLPDMADLPTLKEVKYIRARDDFKEVHLSESARLKMYDDLLYQITLRSIHELFESDVIKAIASIVFNGWVETIDKGTGNKVRNCIMSVQVKPEEFMNINLAQVDPKACFKTLKGIGSSKLHGLAPIQPILQIDRTDKRFVASHEVMAKLDDSENVAAMAWEDFEHLIREIFEKEFSQNGGEVKVTQASRDGGVDAVAFDPDPIRGGKIVIQAKRYTNTVGVSAVRDLYGTVINEGATKGILISTADYGPDAYEFAKGKPLTLLNGNNLLHLLEKHGHKAKIDLREAKKRLAEEKLR